MSSSNAQNDTDSRSSRRPARPQKREGNLTNEDGVNFIRTTTKDVRRSDRAARKAAAERLAAAGGKGQSDAAGSGRFSTSRSAGGAPGAGAGASSNVSAGGEGGVGSAAARAGGVAGSGVAGGGDDGAAGALAAGGALATDGAAGGGAARAGALAADQAAAASGFGAPTSGFAGTPHVKILGGQRGALAPNEAIEPDEVVLPQDAADGAAPAGGAVTTGSASAGGSVAAASSTAAPGSVPGSLGAGNAAGSGASAGTAMGAGTRAEGAAAGSRAKGAAAGAAGPALRGGLRAGRSSLHGRHEANEPQLDDRLSKPSAAGAAVGMAAGAADRARGFGGRAKGFARRHPKLLVFLAALVIAIFMIYPPARDYYVAWRTQSELQATYDAVSADNSALQSDVDRLQSREGIEDEARKHGYAYEGENTLDVQGLSGDDSNQGSNPLDGEVQAEQTDLPWYVRLGDIVFFYTPGSAG